MKKYYYFLFFLLLLGVGNAFSQNTIEKSSISPKAIVDLMALDSIKYHLAPHEPIIFEYDNRGNLILIKDIFSKTINTYNEANLLISSLYYIWDYDSVGFRTHELMGFTYDNIGRLIENTMSVNIDNIWINNTKSIYQYANGLKTRVINFFFDEDLNEWVNSTKTDYLYNDDDLLTNINVYFYDNIGDEEYLGSQTINNYDSDNNMIYSLFESRDSESVLVYGSKTYYIYNSSNLLVEEMKESFSTYSGSVWIPFNKREMTYNNLDLILSQNNYLYVGEDWNLHGIDTFTYDNYKNSILVETYNLSNEAWVCNQKVILVLDYNYTSDDILQHQPEPISSTQIYLPNYSHMLSYYIYGYYNNYTDSWSLDTMECFYSLKSFQFSLSENISYDGSSFIVYPNPAKSNTNIKLLGFEGDIEIIILDINGREHRKIYKQSSASIDIDLYGLNKGIYFISLRNGKYTKTKKLIIN